MTTYKINILAILFSIALLGNSCQKIVHGYISDDIYYQVNPFLVQQGVTTTSASLVLNGSTAPLNTKVISFIDMSTGEDVYSTFSHPDTIVTYTGTVTYQDSTLAMLNAKLKDSTVAPFSVASIGGRLQFTSATSYVDTGRYMLSLEVSNVNGSKTLNNACEVDLTPLTTMDSILYTAWTTSSDAALSDAIVPANNVVVDVDYVNNGENKIKFKFLDKNGVAFNPSKGEVLPRSARPNFSDWDPYYPEVLTDSTFEYQYPKGVPLMPVFDESQYGSGFGKGIVYYQVQGKYTDLGVYVNPVSTIWFYNTVGTYTVTYHLSNVSRVN